MSRTSRASCKLDTCHNQKYTIWKAIDANHDNTVTASTVHFVTLQTTLMPSMSSGERILICDVPFRNCSDSDIPVGQKQGQTTGIIHMSMISEANVFTQTGP